MISLSAVLRRVARETRTRWDRRLHPRRRRRALALLRRPPAPKVVLFVCHGNICRSPFAAAVLRAELGERLRVESAGFVGPGRPTPAVGVAAAAEHGIDLTAHRSRLLTPHVVRSADLVVAMDARQARLCKRYGRGVRVLVLGDLDPGPVRERQVPDPIGGDADTFRACYARIWRCVLTLAEALREARRVSDAWPQAAGAEEPRGRAGGRGFDVASVRQGREPASGRAGLLWWARVPSSLARLLRRVPRPEVRTNEYGGRAAPRGSGSP